MVRIHDCSGVEIFDGSQTHGDTAYITHVQDNPDGYVAQAYKPDGADVTTLHRANCPEISTPHEQNYTQGMFFMAFSHSFEDLKSCAESWPGTVNYCPVCTPKS
jgi:hypothetical protein